MNRKFWFSIVIIILQIISALYISSFISADTKIPSHWNIRGEIDGYMGKWSALIMGH